MLSDELRKGLESLEAELRLADARRVLLTQTIDAMKELLDDHAPVEPIPRRAKRKRKARAKASPSGKPGGRNPRYDWEKGRKLWDAHKSRQDIADALGCPIGTLKNAATRYNWPKRPCGRPKNKANSDGVPKPASRRKQRKKISLTKCPCGAFTTTDPCETCHTKLPTAQIGKMV